MTISIKAKLCNYKEGQTKNNSCRVSEINKKKLRGQTVLNPIYNSCSCKRKTPISKTHQKCFNI